MSDSDYNDFFSKMIVFRKKSRIKVSFIPAEVKAEPFGLQPVQRFNLETHPADRLSLLTLFAP